MLTALGALLNPAGVDLDHLDWAELRRVAERTGVIVRLADALTNHEGCGGWEGCSELPLPFREAAARAAARTQRTLEVVDRLENQCTRLGIPHAFLRVVERYPDSGPDIDLLIGNYSPVVDRLILGPLPASPRPLAVRSRIAGSRTYVVTHGIIVDIHHGRVGQAGEQARFARLLLRRARPTAIGPSQCTAPDPADHFLLLALQRLYTQPAFRLADLYGVTAALRAPDPWSWDYVFATALSMGVVPAVGAYLEYVDRMYTRLFNQPLIAQELLARFLSTSHAVSGSSDERYPRTLEARRLYLRQVQATLEAGRWSSAARLSLLPLLALAARGRHLTRSHA